MKVTLAAAILAACGVVSAFPPGSSSRPHISRHKCGYRPSSSKVSSVPSITPSSSVPSITPSSSVPSSSVPSSISVSSIASSTPPPESSSVASSSVPSSSIPSSTPVSSSIVSSSIASSSAPISSSVPPSSVSSSIAPSSSTPPPPQRTCGLGTAFGYAANDFTTLNTQSGNGCNRWGWFFTPTLAELQATGGVSGILYVGAGNNNINNAVNVGTFTATANAQGEVSVSYALTGSYVMTVTHVDLDCLPITDFCAPGQYTFNSGTLSPAVSTYSTPSGEPGLYPSCSGGSQAYIIVHASVSYTAPLESSCQTPIDNGT
ncbi:hypothetical protein B0T16DRAFT_408191 [Cercophora newfieldiana]|uniref:Uncharacterized protein n=1 Tax=Cercophora newfieldiana TaxID=92897 RepID=A0AA39Y9B2_9PEZI|nr:hypothetical protein B0T16DRAFT_408191 [Cercophora newfieldiana]